MELHQHRGAILFVKLEMTFIVEFTECKRVGMLSFEMIEVIVRLIGCVATLLTNVHLRTALFVGIIMLNVVHLEGVRFERTALSE